MPRYVAAPFAAALTVLLAAAPAAAQMNLQVVPKAGAYTPIGTLTENTELRPGLALGVAAELLLPRLPVNLRANMEYAHTTDIVLRSVQDERVGTASIVNLVADVVARPLPEALRWQPYFMAGAGVKQHTLDRETAAGGELSGVPDTSSRFALHIGAGVDFRFGPVALLVEISDYVSGFEAAGQSRTQHDLFGMVGFRVTMF